MSSEPHLRLADDMRRARALDLARFLNHDDDLPASIAAAAEHPEDWLGLRACHLCTIVGSADALERLDAIPHLDDGFDWSAIPPEDHDGVGKLLLDVLGVDVSLVTV